MRHPNLNRFLVWFGQILFGAPIALLSVFFAGAQVYPAIREWGDTQVVWITPLMTAWWSFPSIALLVAGYVGAFLYSRGHREELSVGNNEKEKRPFMGVTLIGGAAEGNGEGGVRAGDNIRIRGFKSVNNGGDGIRIKKGVSADLENIECRDNKGSGLSIGDDDDN